MREITETFPVGIQRVICDIGKRSRTYHCSDFTFQNNL